MTDSTGINPQNAELIERIEAAFDAPCASYPYGRAFITVKVPDAYAILEALRSQAREQALREALEKVRAYVTDISCTMVGGEVAEVTDIIVRALTETPDAVG